MRMIISILGVRTELVPMQRNKLKGLNADLLLRFAYYTAVFDSKDLYLSLKNEPDARVEKELEKLIENIN